MERQYRDGSAGDADYSRIGQGYRNYRRPEPEFEAAISQALGGATTVLNVGAGAGSYEPRDRRVTAVEPSAAMRDQRPVGLPAAVDAAAENLPLADGAFDAAMTTFSVHQWADLNQGLSEIRRVTTGPIVILTCDPALLDRFWLNHYAPKVIETEAKRYPRISTIAEALGGEVETTALPIPLQCADGFNEAYYGRPEMLLDPAARRSCSAWSFLSEAETAEAESALRRDLDSGHWDQQYGYLRQRPHFDGSLVLVTAQGSGS